MRWVRAFEVARADSPGRPRHASTEIGEGVAREDCVFGTTTGRTTSRTIFQYGPEVAFFGIESSHGVYVREPEGNGVAERFIRTLKENVLLGATASRRSSELRLALLEFKRTYNEHVDAGKVPLSKHPPRCDVTSSGLDAASVRCDILSNHCPRILGALHRRQTERWCSSELERTHFRHGGAGNTREISAEVRWVDVSGSLRDQDHARWPSTGWQCGHHVDAARRRHPRAARNHFSTNCASTPPR